MATINLKHFDGHDAQVGVRKMIFGRTSTGNRVQAKATIRKYNSRFFVHYHIRERTDDGATVLDWFSSMIEISDPIGKDIVLAVARVDDKMIFYAEEYGQKNYRLIDVDENIDPFCFIDSWLEEEGTTEAVYSNVRIIYPVRNTLSPGVMMLLLDDDDDE